MIRIDTDIPVPASRHSTATYPIDTIEPGQSFFVPGAKAASMNSAARRREDKKFVVRTVTEQITDEAGMVAAVKGTRVWRIA